MEEKILDAQAARRLARTIVSDIAAYNKDEVERGIQRDNLFESMAALIEEGRLHYESRVDADLYGLGFYEKALVDFLLKPFASVSSRIW